MIFSSLKGVNKGLISCFSFPNTVEINWQVTGVVGRAELLSSIFYLWALMIYAKSIGKDRHTGLLFLTIFYQSHMCINVHYELIDVNV